MPRTSTSKAAAAALGLLAGFVLAPEAQGPMDRDVTPYAVAVVWKASAPPELPDVSGVRADDWGGRLAPAPAPPRLAPARSPRRRLPAAKPQPAERAAPVAKTSPPAVVRAAEGTVAALPGRECARGEVDREVRFREARHVRDAQGGHAHHDHEAREG